MLQGTAKHFVIIDCLVIQVWETVSCYLHISFILCQAGVFRRLLLGLGLLRGEAALREQQRGCKKQHFSIQFLKKIYFHVFLFFLKIGNVRTLRLWLQPRLRRQEFPRHTGQKYIRFPQMYQNNIYFLFSNFQCCDLREFSTSVNDRGADRNSNGGDGIGGILQMIFGLFG